MMHVTGIGGAPKYGVVSQMPTLGTMVDPLADVSVKRATGDQGSVGYFKSSLENGIVVELAATAHAGLLQYGFPQGQGGSVIVDVSHVLPSFRPFGLSQKYHGGSISVAANGYYGSGTYSNGWNLCELMISPRPEGEVNYRIQFQNLNRIKEHTI
jgi:putative alpha-1,2-mannosidase